MNDSINFSSHLFLPPQVLLRLPTCKLSSHLSLSRRDVRASESCIYSSDSTRPSFRRHMINKSRALRTTENADKMQMSVDESSRGPSPANYLGQQRPFSIKIIGPDRQRPGSAPTSHICRRWKSCFPSSSLFYDRIRRSAENETWSRYGSFRP